MFSKEEFEKMRSTRFDAVVVVRCQTSFDKLLKSKDTVLSIAGK